MRVYLYHILRVYLYHIFHIFFIGDNNTPSSSSSLSSKDKTSKNGTLAIIDLDIPSYFNEDILVYLDNHEDQIKDEILNKFDNLNIQCAKIYASITLNQERNIPCNNGTEETEKGPFFIIPTSQLYTRHELDDLITHTSDTVTID